MPSKASPKTVRITWEDQVAWMVNNAEVLVTNAQSLLTGRTGIQ